jgi:hypothetical protein
MSAWSATCARLDAAGLGPFGVADGALASGVVPGARSAGVVASSKRSWAAFEAWLREDPERFAGNPDPFDAWVAACVAAADPSPEGRVWVISGAPSAPRLDLRRLAVEAGLGAPSRLGLVLHPTLGPWIGLRAVCVTTEVWDRSVPAADAPCDGCAAPCADACPGQAVPAPVLDWRACAVFRASGPTCAGTCHARRACVVGKEHAYSALQHAYHGDPNGTRPALARALGVVDRSDGGSRLGEHAAWARGG